jgi:hypothetical protein
MSAGRSMLDMPRTRYRIWGELASADHHLSVLRKMAADYYALDVRPMWFIPATGESGKIGEFELPNELKSALYDASLAVAQLRAELVRCER